MKRTADSANLEHAKQLVADAGWTPNDEESWEDPEMHFVEACSVETKEGAGVRRVLPAYRVRYWTITKRISIDGEPRAKGAPAK
ncbi:MAG TPA: hypothetical protein VFU97_24280 [Xanthobacteraceae bacterium]|nr:hypothetical protein [Xanthobacteraceae bacterium]